MKEIKFKNLDESIFYEKLVNGMDVYLYPTEKSKNFYVTISVKYGANVVKYKKGNQKTQSTIIPGSAHFLEHKLVDSYGNSELFETINNLGSFSNAYTTDYGTNYNIFGSEDILTNLKILLTLVLNPKISENKVNSEKGIITEEIDLYKDDILSYMYEKIKKNLFVKAAPKYSVLGEKEDIKKITAKKLMKVYKDFYNIHNMFIVVVGNFDKEEVVNFLNDYMSKIAKYPKYDVKVINEREPDEVKVSYEEIKKDIEGSRVFYAVKIPKKKLPKIKTIKRNYYLSILMQSMFSVSAPLYERYKNERLIVNLTHSILYFGSHIVLLIEALTNKPQEYINNLKKDINNFNIDEETFSRKKKVYINTVVMTFENIEDIENLITSQLFKQKNIVNNIHDVLNDLNYKEIKSVEECLDMKNHSIIRTVK